MILQQSKLNDNEKRTVEHPGVYGVNYEIPFDFLNQRCGNLQAVIEKEIQTLTSLTSHDPSILTKNLKEGKWSTPPERSSIHP